MASSAKKRCLSPEIDRTRSSSSKRKKLHSEKKSSRKRDSKHSGAGSKGNGSRKNRKSDTTSGQTLSPKKKLKSISQLARLVQMGKIAIPKSLLHYVEDSPQLLDQLFTILTPEDVKGVLPDILKGLKMKQVKQMCLTQLKLMSSDELRRIILNEKQVAPVEKIQDKTILELTENVKRESVTEEEKYAGEEEDKYEDEEEEKYEGEGEESTHSSSGSSTVTETQVAGTPPFSAQSDKPSLTEVKHYQGADSNLGQQDWPDPSDHAKGRRQEPLRDETLTKKHPKNDGVLASDTSGGEGEAMASSEQQIKEPTTADDDEVCRVGSYAEDYIDLGTGPNRSHIDKELVDGQRNSQLEPTKNRQKERKNSNSEDEYSLESGWGREVPEGARIMEMELRKRALEAALRHSIAAGLHVKSDRQKVVPNTEQTTISEQVSLSTHETASSQSKSGIHVDSTNSSSHASELEVRLRQRALQSMLAKKTQAKLKCM